MKQIRRRRSKRKRPEIAFFHDSLKGFSDDLKTQLSQIQSGNRKQIDLGQSIFIGVLRGLLIAISS